MSMQSIKKKQAQHRGTRRCRQSVKGLRGAGRPGKVYETSRQPATPESHMRLFTFLFVSF